MRIRLSPPGNARIPAIRFITRKWSPAVGGMETYCLRLTEQIGRRHPIEVVALPGSSDKTSPGISGIARFFVSTIFHLIFSRSTKIVHLGDASIWPLGVFAKFRNPGIDVFISAHGSDLSFSKKTGWRGIAYRTYVLLGARLLQKATLIANSEWIADLARDLGFVHTVVVPLGTDLKRSLQAPPNSNALLFVGRITREKGLRFVVEEVLPLLPTGARIRVAGPLWEASEAELLDHPQVEYTGVLDAKALAREYASALAVLVPSRTSEGFGLVALEAAVCGGVVLASDHTGLRDATKGTTAFLLPADNAQAWADRIRHISEWKAADRAQRTASEADGLARIHDWERIAEITLAIYGVHPEPPLSRLGKK